MLTTNNNSSFLPSTSCSFGTSKPTVPATDTEDKYLPQVACVIYTYHGNRELITETYVSWGHHCQTFMVFSDEEWEYSYDKRTIPIRTYPAPKTDLLKDIKKIWNYLGDRYCNHTLHADYITFSGDDAFFIIPNLRKYLSTFSSSARLLIGGTDKILRESAFPWIGGAGYVISRQLIIEKVLCHCNNTFGLFGAAEDMFTSKCLYTIGGVKFIDTRDEYGKYRFCRGAPGDSCDANEEIEPSDEVVLFHYVNGTTRIGLAQKYYGNSSL